MSIEQANADLYSICPQCESHSKSDGTCLAGNNAVVNKVICHSECSLFCEKYVTWVTNDNLEPPPIVRQETDGTPVYPTPCTLHVAVKLENDKRIYGYLVQIKEQFYWHSHDWLHQGHVWIKAASNA